MNQAALDSVSLRVQAEQIADVYTPQSYGRPALLEDPDKVHLLLASLRDGNYREIACRQAGIAKQTFYNWVKRAEAGDEGAIRFMDALEKAEADAEADMVRNVRNASKLPQFWAAAATHLERKSPERWGRRPEDSSAPRVIVQVGGHASDVKVLIQGSETPLSPAPFASTEGRKVDANLQGDKTYALPSCPITEVMVPLHDHVPAPEDVTVRRRAGARFAGPAPVVGGPPLSAGFSERKARRHPARTPEQRARENAQNRARRAAVNAAAARAEEKRRARLAARAQRSSDGETRTG